jgi:two-component system chemotaxis response regulator CheY
MKHFLLIDDDDIICVVHPAIIRQVFPNATVEVIQSATEAMDYIQTMVERNAEVPVAVFIDINMPEINGFNLIEKLSPEAKEFLSQSALYMLSSSVDQRDLDRVDASAIIKGFVGKPLTAQFLKDHFS